MPMSTATGIPEQTMTTPAVVPEPAPPPARLRPRRWPLLAALIVLALVAAAFGIIRAWPGLFSPPLAQVIRASGRIEGREVTLAAKTIQARVKRLLADEGQTVTKGQLLAELDAVQLEAQVAAARASVANVDAQVRQASLDVAYTAKNSQAAIAAADAALSSAHAHVGRTNAILTNAIAAHERAIALFNSGAISKQELDAAEMTLHISRADVTAAEKEVTRAEANLNLAKASADTIGLKHQQLQALQESRRAATARLEEAQANLAERLIVAPDNGTIVSRTAEVGDVVSPGSPIFQVVDMTRLYVKVYIPEPDIAKFRLGDAAEVFVDAFPGRSFSAQISKIYDQAEFTPKNVETAEERMKLVFGVELTVVNPNGVLKPGMPADCVIHWKFTESDGNGHGS
jgi:membrane fusion protein YbhG